MLIKDELRGKSGWSSTLPIHSSDDLMVFVVYLLDSAKDATFVDQIQRRDFCVLNSLIKVTLMSKYKTSDKLEQRRTSKYK
jgi:hypothetical protein